MGIAPGERGIYPQAKVLRGPIISDLICSSYFAGGPCGGPGGAFLYTGDGVLGGNGCGGGGSLYRGRGWGGIFIGISFACIEEGGPNTGVRMLDIMVPFGMGS